MAEYNILKLSSRIVRNSAICVSALLLFAGFYKPEKKLSIFPAMAHEPRIYIGQGKGQRQGEAEVSWLDQSRNSYVCNIIKQAPGMVCDFDVLFYKQNIQNKEVNELKGKFSNFTLIDLSGYDGLRIDLEYIGDVSKEMKNINVFLRSTAKDINTLTLLNEEKIHSIYIPSHQLNKPIDIEFGSFKVADWWASKYNKSISELDLDLNKLIQIGFVVAGISPAGKHQVKINRIDAYGYWLSMENVYLIIILIWLSVFFFEFFARFMFLSYQNNSNRLSLENLQKQYEDVRNESYLDPLTGMYNRRGLRNIIDVVERSNQPKSLGLFVLDIDFFKKINDTYGHNFGDVVLTTIARILKENISATDIIARWGGEEFIVLFECEDNVAMNSFGEKLRKAIERTIISGPNAKKVSITISTGMTFVHDGESYSAAFNRADEALYEAKNTGRNRCCFIG